MLNKEISNRLRAGALAILVEEADEALAVESAKIAAKKFEPVVCLSAADNNASEALEAHKSGEGTLILSDFIRAFGNNPIMARLIREVALQRREKGAYSRLILIETPGVEVPPSLRSDIEYLIPKMPSVKELQQELEDFLKNHEVKLPGNGETKHAIAASVAGLSRHEAARLFARCWIEEKSLDKVWLRKEKATRVAERLGGALTFVEADAPSVGGLDGLKKWLLARKLAFSSEAAKKYGLPEPKGLMLLGIPGTGKSLTAKTISTTWGYPLLRLDAGKLFGSLVGQSEAQTRQAIEAIEACAPCILWIDEIEKGLAGSSGAGDSGTSARVFGTMLTWLQEKTSPVFVVATANRIEALPPELLRKGRFDEIFFVDLPTLDEREEIAAIHIKRHGRDPKKISTEKIAKVTEGFSGAEIEQAIIEGMFNAFADERDVRLNDILDAVSGTVPLSKTMQSAVEGLKNWAKGRAKPATLAPISTNNGSAIRRTPTVA